MEQYHYVYAISYTDVPNIYYGSRSCKCLPEEDVNYWGSPITFKDFMDAHKATRVKTILITGFKNRGDAIAYENNLIQQQWNEDISLSLNGSIGGVKFSSVGKEGYWKNKTRPEESKRKASESMKGKPKNHLIKKYVGISPTGEHMIFTNSRKFCRDNPEWRFTFSKIGECAKGTYPHHKGWRFLFYEDYLLVKDTITPAVPMNVRTFIGIDPNGDRYQFTNAKKFCEDNPEYNLYPGSISTCAKGVINHHKGWRFFYLEDYLAMTEIPPLKEKRKIVGISPDGDHFTFTNVSEFIRNHAEWKLDLCTIKKCCRGEFNHCKGWQFMFYENYKALNGEIPPVVNHRSETYVGLSPDSKKILLTNAKQFCKDNPEYGFSSNAISDCANGRQKSHKGWKFSYADESDIA